MGHPPNRTAPASTPEKRRVQRYITLAYLAFVVYVSLAPGQRVPSILDWSSLIGPDKIAHFGAYAIFAVLLSLSIEIGSPGKRIVVAVIGAALFGGLMELLQAIMGIGRTFDLIDMVANLIGAILGGVLYGIFLYLVNKYSAQTES
jgi:VanZ family protein